MGSYKSNFNFFLILGILLLVFISYRAIHLSITYDETWLVDLSSQSVWDIMFHPNNFHSANNHVLNTLLVKLSLLIFPISEWSIRMPNVLSFVLFYIASIRMAKHISLNKKLQLFFVIAMNSMPFVIDFFSLSRGYGLALALQMLSLSCMLHFLTSKNERQVFFSFGFAFLAVMSNFTWLNYLIPLWLVYNFSLKFRGELILFKNFLRLNRIPIFILTPTLILSLKPILFLSKQNEFQWGANAWIDSFHHLAKDFNYSDSFVWAVFAQVFLFLLFLWIGINMITKYIKTNHTDTIFSFVMMLLLSIILFTIMQRLLLGTRYMDGRKALMYFVFIPFLLLKTILFISEKFKHTNIILYLFGAVLTVHFFFSVKINSIREWEYDSDSKEVAKYIAEHPIEGFQGVGVNWLFSPSLTFYNRYKFEHKIEPILKIDDALQRDSLAYYYIFNSDAHVVPDNFEIAMRFNNGRFLFKRRNKF